MNATWIVVIATVTAYASVTLDTGPLFTPSSSSLSTYTVPAPPIPVITVLRAATKEEAETLALGFKVHPGGGMQMVEPYSFGSSRSAVVISPDGKVSTVSRVEKKRKVLREVEETEGWEIVWKSETPQSVVVP